MAATSTADRPKRRRLRFHSFDEMFAEIESLRTRPHVQTGNWSLSVIVEHLARAIEMSIDGGTFPVPWYFKLIGPWLLKPRLLNRGMPSGFQLPGVVRKRLIPEGSTDSAQAIAHLRQCVERMKTQPPQSRHPVLGALTPAEWNELHLRHAELHLGFLVPE